VLLHQHRQAMQDYENGMCPRPVTMVRPPAETGKICHLPNLLCVSWTGEKIRDGGLGYIHSEAPIQGRSNANIRPGLLAEARDKTP